MKLFKAMIVAITLTSLISAAPRNKAINNSNEKPDMVPQIMVANFFTILVQGALAVSSKEDPEKQLQATAAVLNSIANLAQLAMRKAPSMVQRNPDTTAREIFENLMHDTEFLAELDLQRPQLHAALVAALANTESTDRPAPHSERAQTD